MYFCSTLKLKFVLVASTGLWVYLVKVKRYQCSILTLKVYTEMFLGFANLSPPLPNRKKVLISFKETKNSHLTKI